MNRGRAAALWVLFGALWIWLDVAIPLRHLGATSGDFRAYHQAARALLDGVSPYSEPAFIYPPLLPVLLLPLAPLPLETARWIWFVVSELALLGSLALTIGALSRAADRRTLAAGAVWIVAGTTPANLVLGQLNPLLLALVTLALWWLRRHPGRAAAAIGLAAALKVWPGLALLAFAWRRQWRPLGAGLAVAIALVAAPAAVVIARVQGVDPLGGDRALRVGSAAPLNISLPALALRVVDPPRGERMPPSWIDGVAPSGFEPWSRHGWLAAGVAGATLGAALVALGSPRRGRPAARAPDPFSTASPADGAGGEKESRDALDGRHGALGICALLSAAMLAAPVGWYHYQLCQLPAFAIVLERQLTTHRWRAAALVIATLAALTRAPAWLFGLYVERLGWTAQSPAALWIATSAGPLLATLWTMFLLREARAAAASAGGPLRAA